MRTLGGTLRRICWWFDAHRIAWVIFFPFALYFSWHGNTVLAGVFILASTVIITFRKMLGNIRIGILYKAKLNERIRANAMACECFRRLRNSPEPKRPIALFLRPFSGDVGIHSKDPDSVEGYDPYAIETRLVEALEREYLCVSLASPGTPDLYGDVYAGMGDVTTDHRNFGRYEGRLFYAAPGEIKVSDAEWPEAFRLLARRAALTVSIPIDMSVDSERSGTIEELLHITSNCRDRCVFVMPPEQEVLVREPVGPEGRDTKLRGWGRRPRQLSVLWEATREKLELEGVRLPNFEDTPESGVTLFAQRGEGTVAARIPHAVVKTPRRFLEAIKDVHTRKPRRRVGSVEA